EEHLGYKVKEAMVHYAADRKTVTISMNAAMRRALNQALIRARELRRSTHRPPIAENERLCAKCSLAPVCLPEEERFVHDPDRDVIRLFPEKHETWDVHVVDAGSTVRRNGDSLVVENREGNKQRFPI